MRKVFLSGLVALGIGVAGCDLTGPKLSQDPNNPTSATNASLFASAQAALWVQSESDLARTVCVWVQQCAGRLSQYFGVDNYSFIGDGEFWVDNWARTYGGGGLIDLRTIQRQALAAGDSTFAGIAIILEAWMIGTAADVWGDVPYSQASQSITAPALDAQQVVYATIQARLDTAIVYLNAPELGPKQLDPVYQGDRGRWQRLAYTLKARYFIHTAERLPAAYDSVLVYAPQGIIPGEDYLNFHTASLASSNIWFQFFSTAAQDYIAAGAFGVNLLLGLNDFRLLLYYSPSPADVTGTIFVGGEPGGNDTLTVGTISSLGAVRLAPEFQQPLVTWAEGQLLQAEANLQSQSASNPGAAKALLDAVRASNGLPPVPAGLSNAELLDSIMIEKYIQTFQNIEGWSDYRRTCIPALSPPTGFPRLPTRLPYPLSERNANPSISDPGPDPFTGSNWNDPNPCP